MSLIETPKITVRTRVNDPTRSGHRMVVEGEVVGNNHKTVWIKLEDGTIIKRNKKRDLL